MAKDIFRFKHFSIAQDRCAMKVGTDGVILGAWASAYDNADVLDVGCGTGLISLMMAQRFHGSRVVGIEIDADAARQALENVNASVFASDVCIKQADVRQFDGSFDAIVCNPPFYSEHTLSPVGGRQLARSSQLLPFADLMGSVNRLLRQGGVFSVIIPCSERVDFHRFALANGFDLWKTCFVKTLPSKEPKRVMLCYVKGRCELMPPQLLVLQNSDGSRSEQLKQLTADFYLW